MTDLTTLPQQQVARPTTPDDLAAAWLLGYSSRETRAAYRHDLREWRRFLDAVEVDLWAAHRAHVEAFCRHLEQVGRAPSTVARKVAALASFYAYAEDEGFVAKNPCSRVRRPKTDQDSPRLGLDKAELKAFLKAPEKPLDRALCHLLALNGLRISSALNLDVEDLSTERGHTVLHLVLKGGRRKTVPIAPATAEALAALLDGRETGPIFQTSTGKRLDRVAAFRLVRRLAQKAGIDKAISPHSLRHSFVSEALEAGVELWAVQQACGHADPRTTMGYQRAKHQLERHPCYTLAARVL